MVGCFVGSVIVLVTGAFVGSEVGVGLALKLVVGMQRGSL